jgi:UrcA family protein
MNRLVSTSLAAAAFLVLTSGAQAGQTELVRHRVVAYGDINFDNDADVQILAGRLRLAMHNVCAPTSLEAAVASVNEAKTYAACRKAAAEKALVEIGDMRVATAFHADAR